MSLFAFPNTMAELSGAEHVDKGGHSKHGAIHALAQPQRRKEVASIERLSDPADAPVIPDAQLVRERVLGCLHR